MGGRKGHRKGQKKRDGDETTSTVIVTLRERERGGGEREREREGGRERGERAVWSLWVEQVPGPSHINLMYE